MAKIKFKANSSVRITLPEGRTLTKKDLINIFGIKVSFDEEDLSEQISFSEEYLNNGFTVEKDIKEVIKIFVTIKGKTVDLKKEILFELMVEKSNAVRDFEEIPSEQELYRLYEHYLMLGHNPGNYNIPEMEYRIPEDINVEAVDVMVRPIRTDRTIDDSKNLVADDFEFDKESRYITWKFRNPKLQLPFNQEKTGFIGLAYSIVVKEKEPEPEPDPWADFSTEGLEKNLDTSLEDNDPTIYSNSREDSSSIKKEDLPIIDPLKSYELEDKKEENENEVSSDEVEPQEQNLQPPKKNVLDSFMPKRKKNSLVAEPFRYGEEEKNTGNSVFKKEKSSTKNSNLIGFDNEEEDDEFGDLDLNFDEFSDDESYQSKPTKTKSMFSGIKKKESNYSKAPNKLKLSEDDEFGDDLNLDTPIEDESISKKKKKKPLREPKPLKTPKVKKKGSKKFMIALLSGTIVLGGLGVGTGLYYKSGVDASKPLVQELTMNFQDLDELLKKDKLNTDEKLKVSNLLNQSFKALEDANSKNLFAVSKKKEMIDQYNVRIAEAEKKLNN